MIKTKNTKTINFLEVDYIIKFKKDGELFRTPDLTHLLLALKTYCYNLSKKSVKYNTIDIDDLTQELWIESVKIIKLYDNRKGNTFKSFLYACLFNHLKNLTKSKKKRMNKLNSQFECIYDFQLIYDTDWLEKDDNNKGEN